jgi:hypothetical protein
MQIALTKKLADVMGIKPAEGLASEDPLFSWTANRTNVWENRKAENMLVLVNHATRFAVAIYEVKRKDLKNAQKIMTAAIRNTLLALNLNPEIVDEYMRMAGEVTFTVNRDRQYTAWINHAGLECAIHVGRKYDNGLNVFDDTVAAPVNHNPVGYSKNHDDGFIPKEKLFDALAKLTDKPVYHYRAFELTVTLDLEIYKAVRRLIVPADIKLQQLHDVLQLVFHWRNCHLHDWEVFDGKNRKPVHRLVMYEESLEYVENAVLETGHTLSEYFPANKRIIYTYDMGDSWEHLITLVRVIDEYDEESPYLLEATGQDPPEDVGGVGGYINFREIMLDPKHEDYPETKEWAGYWQPELRDWQSRPQVIHNW